MDDGRYGVVHPTLLAVVRDIPNPSLTPAVETAYGGDFICSMSCFSVNIGFVKFVLCSRVFAACRGPLVGSGSDLRLTHCMMAVFPVHVLS